MADLSAVAGKEAEIVGAIGLEQEKSELLQQLRTMREELDQFNEWKLQWDHDRARLKQHRRRQSQIARMAVMHSKRQNVLRRKIKETVALNKRLKDTLALGQACQEAKNSGKIDNIGQWIKQEVDLYAHVVEAKVTLSSLIEDRATLQEEMDTLPDDSSKKEKFDIRSLEIEELERKILDFDEDAKSKTRFDRLKTLGEAKFALKLLFEIMGDIKQDQMISQKKIIDLQGEVAEQKKRYKELKKTADTLKKNADREAAEDEDKISVLTRQLEVVTIKGEEDAQEEGAKEQADNDQDSDAALLKNPDEDDDYEPEDARNKKKGKRKNESGDESDFGLEDENGDPSKKGRESRGSIKHPSAPSTSSQEPSSTATGGGTPTIEKVCSTLGLTDVEVEYTETEFQNLMTCTLFQLHVRPLLAKQNPTVSTARLMILVAAKWREFSKINPYLNTENPESSSTSAIEDTKSGRARIPKEKDESIPDDDDSLGDPDWRETPRGVNKGVSRMKFIFKRDNGGCTCTKSSCDTIRCGCKKQKHPCTSVCKCTHNTCNNRDSDTEESDDA